MLSADSLAKSLAALRLLLVMAASTLLLSACAETQLATYAAKRLDGNSGPGAKGGSYKIGNPYQVGGVWYYPAADPTYDHTGIASWYGAPFHGQATANGEVYDQNELTAAHQTLPLPTYARVTNLENGRSIVVRINDRGPFVNGRVIDLSRRAAQLLGYEQKGTARVRVQVIRNGDEAPPGPAIARAAPPPAQTAVAAARPSPEIPPTDFRNQTIRQEPVQPSGIFIQAGAFSQVGNANRLRARLESLGSARVSQTQVNGTDFYRVRLGPLRSVEQADQALQRVINLGQTDARIVIN